MKYYWGRYANIYIFAEGDTSTMGQKQDRIK